MLSKVDSASAEIAFIDLKAQRERLGAAIDNAIRRVLEHGQFVLGREVEAAEAALAAFCGAAHVIACANGTDALALLLMAKGIGPGDAVIVPGFTFAAPAEVVALRGATIVFADVRPDSFNLDPDSLAAGIALARKHGLRPAAVVAVDLFGQPADYATIEPICRDSGLFLIADGAQSFGASRGGRKVGTFGGATGTSFFPAKPLGCYGDGGAVFTDDADLASVLRSLRVHGQGTNKYDNVRIGLNGRLDTIQAAVLLQKLAIFDDEIAARDRIARRYQRELTDVVDVPALRPEATSAWAQFTVGVEERDDVADALSAASVPTAIYYPVPLHRQPAYNGYPVASDGLPVSERLAGRVLSLPMHPYLSESVQDRVVGALRAARR
jgi:dTDP-4-amino-4,6-dideoxygalactose transaminase